MDEALFIKDELPGEFEARFSVRGEIRLTIKADSLEDARAKAEAMLEDENFALELDEADEVSVDNVWKSNPMFLVTRDGQTMRVSTLQEGDEPREPTERGF